MELLNLPPVAKAITPPPRDEIEALPIHLAQQLPPPGCRPGEFLLLGQPVELFLCGVERGRGLHDGYGAQVFVRGPEHGFVGFAGVVDGCVC